MNGKGNGVVMDWTDLYDPYGYCNGVQSDHRFRMTRG